MFHELVAVQSFCQIATQHIRPLADLKRHFKWRQPLFDIDIILLCDVHSNVDFLSHISAHTVSKQHFVFSTNVPPFPLQNIFEIYFQPLLWSRVIKELKLPSCSFTGDVVRQTNKESERLTLLFGVNYILYSIIPKRRSFVVKDWANCRAWWYYCTIPRQSCQDEIQLPSVHTKTQRKRRREHRGGWYGPVWKQKWEEEIKPIKASALLFCPGLWFRRKRPAVDKLKSYS